MILHPLLLFIYFSRLLKKKKKERKRGKPTFTKRQTSPLLLCGPSALLFSVKARVQEVRSYTDVTREEYLLTIIVWSNYFFLPLKEEPLQVMLLSRDILGFSAVSYGDHTSPQYPEQVLLVACTSKHRAQSYLSNILRHFWFDCKNHRFDYLTSPMTKNWLPVPGCAAAGLYCVLFLWRLVSMFTVLTNAE